MKVGRKPLVSDKDFIECWNKHLGNAVAVAEELNLKRNTTYVRGSRLLRKYGMLRQRNTGRYELKFEEI